MSKKSKFSLAIAASLALGATSAMASERDLDPAVSFKSDVTVEQSIKDRIRSISHEDTVTRIEQSPIHGLYEVEINSSQILYMSSDARHFIPGDLMRIDMMGIVNLTDQQREVNRMKLLGDFERKDVISYDSNNEKIRVSVFTDIDCPYCRKLHEDIQSYLDAGISIDYYAFPRSGPNTPSFEKYEYVMCSEDRKSALNQAMKGSLVDEPEACDSAAEDQFMLGEKLGVTGTPSFISIDGTLVPGLLPPDALLREFGL